MDTVYYIAPTRILGNWSKYNEIKFDLKTEGNFGMSLGCQESNKCEGDFVIYSGTARASYRLHGGKRNGDNWRTYTIPLREDSYWTITSGNLSLSQILTTVTKLKIRAKFAESITGFNVTSLDNISFYSKK